MPRKKLVLRHSYLAELNRCIGDNTTSIISRLTRRGYDVERVAHLTTLKIKRPPGLSFSEMKADLRDLLQPRRGSIILSSSGRAWLCSMRGNQPGRFQRIQG